MKKSRRLFSFLAVALSAVLLFASAGALNTAKQVALAETAPYGKVFTKDSLKVGDYLEYGEYPQSEITGDHATKIKELINTQFYSSSTANISTWQVSTIMNKRKNNSSADKNFTYDSTTGYFVANQDIKSGSDTILSKGDKIMEYISGVDAANKYPVYMIDSRGNTKSTSDTKAYTSIRSATVRAYIDGIWDGTYYNNSGEMHKCECIYCESTCSVGNGTVYTNTSSNEALSSTSHNWSTSWYDSSDCYTLYESQTSKNLNYYVGIIGFGHYTGPSDDSTFYNNYYKYTNYFVNSSTKSFCYRDGKPLSNVGYDTGKFTYMNEGSDLYNYADWLYNQAKSLTESKCGKDLANNQIYKIEIVSPTINYNSGMATHSYTCSYTIRVWATTNTNTCPYCSEVHHHGDSSNRKSFTSENGMQYILGQNTTATTNGYTSGSQFYFKVEPIKWKVVEKDSSGNYTLQSNTVLDSIYYNLYSNSGNNFQSSYLCNWLNYRKIDETNYYNAQYYVPNLKNSTTVGGYKVYGGFNEITNSEGRYDDSKSYYGLDYDNYGEYSSKKNGKLISKATSYVSGADGIKSNTASYGTTAVNLTGNINSPSFFSMAFSNVDTSLMRNVGQSTYYGYKDFETSKKSSEINSNNLVTIPYSSSSVVKDSATKTTLSNVKTFSAYAVATGAICKYNSNLADSKYNFDENFKKSYGQGIKGLIWIENNDGDTPFDGSANSEIFKHNSNNIKNVLQQKSVASVTIGKEVADTDDSIASNYNQINQSAGVVPVIKINLGSKDNILLVQKNAVNSETAYQVTTETDEGLIYKLVTVDAKKTEASDFKISKYSKISGNTGNTIELHYSYNKDYEFDYIKFVITNRGDYQLTSDDDYYTSVETALYSDVYKKDNSYCVIIGYNDILKGISTDQNDSNQNIGAISFTLKDENNKNLFLYKNFEIRAYVGNDKKSKETEISGDEIRTIKYKVFNYVIEDGKYKVTPSEMETVFLYEGQSKEIDLQNNAQYYSSATYNENGPIFDGVLLSESETLYAVRSSTSEPLQLLIGSTTGENLLAKENIKKDTNGYYYFYSNYSGNPFSVAIVHLNETEKSEGVNDADTGKKALSLIRDSIYITDGKTDEKAYYLVDYGDTTENPTTYLATKTLTGISGMSGIDLKFRVYIKNAFINTFANVSELVNGKKITTTDEKGIETEKTIKFIKFYVFDDEEGNVAINTTNTTIGQNTAIWDDEHKNSLTISELKNKKISNGGQEEVYEKYFEVTVRLTVGNSENKTRLKLVTLDGFAYIEQNTYSLSGNASNTVAADDTTTQKTDKMSYASGVFYSAKDGANTKLNDTEVQNSTPVITHGSTLEADFNLNVGYELKKTYNTNGVLESYTTPSISLQYATQATDANGYRLAKDSYYPEDGDYASNGLKGTNIRLDENGNRLDFDANGNLKRYLKIDTTVYDLNYLNGASYYLKYDKENKQYSANFVAPIIMVKFDNGKEIKEIEFTPIIWINETEYTKESTYKSFNDAIKTLDDNSNLERIGTEENVEYYKIKDGGAVVKYVCSEVNSNAATETETNKYKLLANNKNNSWTFKIDNGDNGIVSCNTITISDNKNDVRSYSFDSGSANYKVSMTATYRSTEYASREEKDDATEGTLTNNSYTGFNYTGQLGSEKITLISSDSSESYEPWAIYANSTLGGGKVSITSSGTDYDQFQLATGYQNSNWYNSSKQFFLIAPDGSQQEMKPADSNNWPSITMKDGTILYAYLNNATGMFEPRVKSSDGRFDPKLVPGKYSGYKVVCIDPITIDVYVVKADNELQHVSTSDDTSKKPYYKAGETVFRLRVNSIVSNVRFTLNDSTVSEYNYKINFQTDFNGERYSSDNANLLTISNDWNVSVTNGGQINAGAIKSDIIKTIGTAENGQMLIQYYDEIESNITSGTTSTNKHHYYFLAPIDTVVASCINEDSKASNNSDNPTIKITSTFDSIKGYTYYATVNGSSFELTNGTNYNEKFIYYTDGTNMYYFTNNNVVYQFAGWQVTSIDGLDDEAGSTASQLNEKVLSTSELNAINFKFKDTKTSPTFKAVYEECEVNVEFYSWNMSEDDNGIYNVIKKISEVEENQDGYDSYYDDHYKEVQGDNDTTIYSVKGIEYNQKDFPSEKKTPIENYITNVNKFAGNSASAYGESKGWFRKSNNAEYDIAQKLGGKASIDALGLGSYSDLQTLIGNAQFATVIIWDGQEMYTNTDRTVYFSVTQNGSNYNCEYYSKFVLGEDTFTNNTKLYEIYEINNKKITLSDFTDKSTGIYTNESNVISNAIDSENVLTDEKVEVAKDLTFTINLTDAYSKAIKDNVENFIMSLTIKTTSKYNVGGEYGINFSKDAYDSTCWNGDTRKYVFRSVTTTVAGEDGKDVTTTEEYGYIQFNENYTVITISIRGVIADVNITTNYIFNRNSYEITIDSPVRKDGQGEDVSYGNFYIVFIKVSDDTEETMTQEEVEKEINFKATTQIILDDGSVVNDLKDVGDKKIIAKYTFSSGQLKIVVYYDYDLYIMFKPNEAFSQYFNEGVLWQAKVDKEILDFTNTWTAFDTGSDQKLQYFKDSTNSVWYYGLMHVSQDYVLSYSGNIYINRYYISNASNKTYYETSFDNEKVDNNGNGYAEYNENVDVIITIKDAYTQFTPVVTANINGTLYPIVFAHLYNINQANGSYATIHFDNTSETVSMTYCEVDGSKYYEYPDYKGSRTFRVYADPVAEGEHAGYYKFVEVSDDTEKIITYINYNFEGSFAKIGEGDEATTTKTYKELSYNYIIKNLNVKSNLQYYVYGYKGNSMWSADKKNTYEINVGDLSNDHENYYTVTGGADGDDGSLSYDITSGGSNPLANVTHGDQVVIKVTMKDNYTQTIPKFKITVGEKTYTINCTSGTIISGVDEKFTIDNKDTKIQDEGNGTLSRTYTFSIAGLEISLKQEFEYDSIITSSTLSDFRFECKLDKVSDGNDNKMYSKATYIITVIATDSFTITDITDKEEEDSSAIGYNLNQYYVVFNRQVNGEDKGVVTYVHDDIAGGAQKLYYQVITSGEEAKNPFKTADPVTAPHDPSKLLSLENFKGESIEGYSYVGTEENPWTTDLTTSAQFDFDTMKINHHYILYAPYAEEQYTVEVKGTAVDNSTDATKWDATNNHYGKLTTNFSDADTNVLGTQVKYTSTGTSNGKEGITVSYQLFHAYDHSSIKFSISQYGELQYNEGKNTDQTTHITIYVSKKVNGNITTYTYRNSTDEKSDDNILATVTITTNGETSLGGLSTIYTLKIVKCIDAGNTAVGNADDSDKPDGRITIGVEFVKGSTDVTDEATGLNIYNVYIHKAQFKEEKAQDVMNKNIYTGHIYKTIDEIDENWTNITDGVASITIIHGGTLSSEAVKNKEQAGYDGYAFKGWLTNGGNTKLNETGSNITNISDVIHLYEWYGLKDAYTITLLNSIGNLNKTDKTYGITGTLENFDGKGVFKEANIQGKTQGKTLVQYTDGVTVTFTLGDAYTKNNEGLTFTVNNAIITECTYNGSTFTYTLTLKYFKGDGAYSVSLSDDVKSVNVNTYEVKFMYYYGYDSNFEGSWTQKIENITKYNFKDADKTLDGTYIHGSDAGNRVAVIPEIGTIPELKNGLVGFSNSDNAWMYISCLGSNGDIGDDDIKEVILAILNKGDCLSEGTVLVENEDITYTVGLYIKGTVDWEGNPNNDGTPILGTTVVVPYYVRNEIEVTFEELIEGSADFSMIKDEEFKGSVSDNALDYSTTYVPYGLPLDKKYLKDYIYTSADDNYSILEHWFNVVTQFEYDKNEHFIFGSFEIGKKETELSSYPVKEEITISVNYTRRTYTVELYKNRVEGAPHKTYEVKYGEEFGNEYEVEVNGETTTIEKIVKGFSDTTGTGKHISGWKDKGNDNDVEGQEMVITENRSFYPSMADDIYTVTISITKLNKDQNEDQNKDQNKEHDYGLDVYYAGGTTVVKNEDGSYNIESGRSIIVEYVYTTGYAEDPNLKFEVKGNVVGKDTADATMSLTGNTRKLTITFNVQNLGHENNINITIEEQISTYGIDWSTPESITTNNITYNGDSYSSGDKIGYTYTKSGSTGFAVVFYINENQKTVNYDNTLTVFVGVADRYLRNSSIKFTISAGGNERVFTLDKNSQSVSDESGLMIFECTLKNITDNIVITIDGSETEIIPSQYEITYHYYFGGGVNDWNDKLKSSVTVTVQASDTTTGTYNIVGGSAPKDQEVPTDYNNQYRPYNNGTWYVIKDDLKINFADINYENIQDYFDEFTLSTYKYKDDIDVYYFYIVVTKDVNVSNVNADKGNLQRPSIGGNYVADYQSEYEFSYEIKEQYSQNIPVITITNGGETYDLIALKNIANCTIKKSSTESYVVTLTANGYKYVLSTNTLGAVGGNTYFVTIDADGTHIYYGTETSNKKIATVKFENNKQIITLARVEGDLSIDVNDEMFELNSYKITFKHGDGSVDELTVKYGNKLIDIPTDEKSFIQKLVYIVTYSDGTTKQLSSKGLAKMEISDDLTIEIEVEINLVILIPLVVGAVVVVVAIVVGITKVTRNRNDRHSSGKSNMEAFDRLRQDRGASSTDTSKKSDRPYNPYIDNSKDRKQ